MTPSKDTQRKESRVKDSARCHTRILLKIHSIECTHEADEGVGEGEFAERQDHEDQADKEPDVDGRHVSSCLSTAAP